MVWTFWKPRDYAQHTLLSFIVCACIHPPHPHIYSTYRPLRLLEGDRGRQDWKERFMFTGALLAVFFFFFSTTMLLLCYYYWEKRMKVCARVHVSVCIERESSYHSGAAATAVLNTRCWLIEVEPRAILFLLCTNLIISWFSFSCTLIMSTAVLSTGIQVINTSKEDSDEVGMCMHHWDCAIVSWIIVHHSNKWYQYFSSSGLALQQLC